MHFCTAMIWTLICGTPRGLGGMLSAIKVPRNMLFATYVDTDLYNLIDTAG